MANKKIRGITIQLGADAKPMDKALSGLNKTSASLNTELKQVNKLMKFDPGNTTLAAQKQKILSEAVENTKTKLDGLKQAQDEVDRMYKNGEIGDKEYRDFQRTVEETEQSLKSYEGQIGRLGSEQDRLKQNTSRLQTLFEVTGTSIDDFSDILGNRLTNAIKDGTASSDQLETAINKIGRASIGSDGDIAKLKSALDSIDDGESVENVRKQIKAMGDSTDDAKDKVGHLTELIQSGALLEVADRASQVADKIKEIGDASVEAAATMQANDAQFEQVFGNMTDAAHKTVDEIGKSMGILPKRLEPGYAAISSQLMSLGVDQKQAMDLAAQALTESADAAAFYDTSLEDAKGSVQSFLKGNLSAAESIGIFATANGLAEYATEKAGTSANKAGKKYEDMTEAEKQVLRVDYISTMQEQAKVTGQAKREMDGYENVMGNVTSAQDELKAAIGEEALKMVVEQAQKLIPTLEKIVKWIKELNPQIKQAITIAAAVTAVMGTILPIIAALSLAAKGLKIDIIPLVGIIVGIIVAITAAIMIFKNWGAITDWLSDKWSKFKNWIANLWDGIKDKASDIWNGIGDAITGAIDMVKQTASDIWNGIGDTLSGIWNGIKDKASDIWNGIGNFLGGIWGGTEDKASSVWEGIKDKLSSVWESIKDVASNVWDGISDFFGGIWNGVQDTVETVWNAIAGFFKTIWDVIYGIFKVPIDLIKAIVEGVSYAIYAIVVTVWELIKFALNKVWTWITDTASTVFGALSDFFSGIWNTIKDVATTVWNAISGVIVSVWNSIHDAVATVISTILDVISSVWGKISVITSTVWNTIKAVLMAAWTVISSTASTVFNAISSFFSGIWNGIKNVVSTVWDAITGKLSAVWNSIKTTATTVFSALSTFFSGIWNGIKDTVSSVWNKITSTLIGIWDSLKTKAMDIFGGMWDGITNGFNKLKDTVGGIVSKVANAIIKPIGGAVNGVIKGMNWILDKIGSNHKPFALWEVPKFAKGAGGLPEDTIGLVNDQKGSTYREMIVPPHGQPYIPDGRDVMLPMEKGTKIMPAKQTKSFLESIPHFAKGIGEFFGNAWEKVKSFTGNVWDYISHPGKIVQIAIDKFTDLSDAMEPGLSIAKGAVNSVFNGVKDFIKKQFDTVSPEVNYKVGAGVEQWRGLATQALQMTGQYSPSNLAAMLHQMQTESGGNPRAINNWDINAKRGTPSKGLMQVIDPTFRAYAMPGHNNIWDPLSNMLASIRYAVSRYGSLARAYRGRAYADGIGQIDLSDIIPSIDPTYFEDGGILTKPGFFKYGNGKMGIAGEGSTAEAITPVDKLKGYITSAILDVFGDKNINIALNITDNIDGRTLAKNQVQYTQPLLDKQEQLRRLIKEGVRI